MDLVLLSNLPQNSQDSNSTESSTNSIDQNDQKLTTQKKVKNIIIGHIGDGKIAIFKKNGEVTFKTIEQTPDQRNCLERLREQKIKLKRKRMGGTLAMCNSLCDIQTPGMVYMPEITEINCSEDDKWLVIACDGIWDDIDLDSCGKLLRTINDAPKAAVLLRDMAYSRGSEDNISIIVIDLENHD